MPTSRLALGTVQFGLAYGATHAGGRVSDGEAQDVLVAAREAGIDTLDTAAAYGEAEAALGRIGAAGHFRIVTKTAPAAAPSPAEIDRIADRFMRSLRDLDAPAVDGLMVHAVGALLAPGGDRLWRKMEDWRRQGLVRRIGASVYDGAEVDALLDRFDPDLVQLPLSVLDQRLLLDGSIAKLARRGAAVHLRSVFLQGLLLQEPAAAPPRLSRTRPHLERWWTACRTAEARPLEAALGFALGIEGVERVVVGVHSVAHLREIVAAETASPPGIDVASLAADDDAVDPRRWPTEAPA